MSLTLTTYTAADHDWVVDAHATHYASEEGFDDTFGPLVDEILTAFDQNHDDTRECGWIAWQGGRRLGSIFCVDTGDGRAKLRLFLLTPDARGQGAGRRLLDTCTSFARAKGYTGMILWTHAEHQAACRLYAKNGWRCTASAAVTSFGRKLTEQTWQIDFQ